MSYIKLLIESILTEEVNITKVADSIRKRKPVKIKYEADDEPSGRGERIIHPVAYGISKAGNLVVRAFQPYGDTKTRTPHWKMFRLDKIQNWDILWKRASFEEPPGQFNAVGKYNETGDKSMTTVYLNANFNNSRDYYSGKKGQGLYNYNKEREKAKNEREPFYKLKQNITNSNTDNIVQQRINKYPSQNAKKYVTNDDYINDMNKVDVNTPTQPQTVGPISKGDIKNQNTSNDEQLTNVSNLENKPVFRNDVVKNNNEENIEDNERNTFK